MSQTHKNNTQHVRIARTNLRTMPMIKITDRFMALTEIAKITGMRAIGLQEMLDALPMTSEFKTANIQHEKLTPYNAPAHDETYLSFIGVIWLMVGYPTLFSATMVEAILGNGAHWSDLYVDEAIRCKINTDARVAKLEAFHLDSNPVWQKIKIGLSFRLSVTEIATELELSPSAVESEIKVMGKLGFDVEGYRYEPITLSSPDWVELFAARCLEIDTQLAPANA